MKRLCLSALLCLVCCALLRAQSDTVFASYPVPDSVFVRMQGKSYKLGCPVPRAELRYLRLSYCNADGETHTGEMVCHRAIAGELVSIFRELWKAGYRIGTMQLIDDFGADDQRSMEANNTSCFNYRTVAGSTVVSKHGRGMAVDVNPLYNPCVRGNQVEPASGRKWAWNRKRTENTPYLILRGDLCYRLFRQYGFRWGGDWRSLKDYQHFEK